jgi:hypothetical protein
MPKSRVEDRRSGLDPFRFAEVAIPVSASRQI